MNKNSIKEEIKSQLKSGNACYYSVQNLLSSSMLPRNIEINIYRTIIFPVDLHGCETWSLILRVFLISNFCRVLYVVCFLLGNSPSV
jgi:hypothetical protein